MTGNRVADWQERFENTLDDLETLYSDGREMMKNLRAEIARLRENCGFEEPTESGGKLQIPYVSQWGVGADKRKSDCGPAAIASIIHAFTDYRPTVDEVADACGQSIDGYTNASQLIRGAAQFGVRLKYRRPLVTGELIEYILRDGFPSVPLIDYKVLREGTNHLGGIVRNQDQQFSAGHWVCFVGFEDARGVYIHDPNFWGEKAPQGAYRWIPWEPWTACLASAAAGNSYGNQGLVVEGVDD